MVVILVILYIVGSIGSSTSNPTAAQRSSHRHRRRPRVIPKTTTTTAPVVVPATATLQMVPTAPVYVCLVNGSGTKLINERTFTVGETIPSEHAPKLLLTLGNASVQMKVNGKPMTVTPSPTAIRLLITPTSVTHIPDSQTPTCP